MSNILFPATIFPSIRNVSLAFLCPSKRLISANCRYVKLGSSPKQLTKVNSSRVTYPIKDRPNESSFQGPSVNYGRNLTDMFREDQTTLHFPGLSIPCFYSSNKHCQVSTAWPVEAVSTVLQNSFPLCLFSFPTFNDRTSGSALQPLRCRPSEGQGSSANTRQEETNHQRFLEGLVMQGPKGLSKLAQNGKTI